MTILAIPAVGAANNNQITPSQNDDTGQLQSRKVSHENPTPLTLQLLNIIGQYVAPDLMEKANYRIEGVPAYLRPGVESARAQDTLTLSNLDLVPADFTKYDRTYTQLLLVNMQGSTLRSDRYISPYFTRDIITKLLPHHPFVRIKLSSRIETLQRALLPTAASELPSAQPPSPLKPYREQIVRGDLSWLPRYQKICSMDKVEDTLFAFDMDFILPLWRSLQAILHSPQPTQPQISDLVARSILFIENLPPNFENMLDLLMTKELDEKDVNQRTKEQKHLLGEKLTYMIVERDHGWGHTPAIACSFSLDKIPQVCDTALNAMGIRGGTRDITKVAGGPWSLLVPLVSHFQKPNAQSEELATVSRFFSYWPQLRSAFMLQLQDKPALNEALRFLDSLDFSSTQASKRSCLLLLQNSLKLLEFFSKKNAQYYQRQLQVFPEKRQELEKGKQEYDRWASSVSQDYIIKGIQFFQAALAE